MIFRAIKRALVFIFKFQRNKFRYNETHLACLWIMMTFLDLLSITVQHVLYG